MAANNRKFQEFMARFAADTVSTKVRSLMWECWVAATAVAETGEPTHNTSNTQSLCMECGNWQNDECCVYDPGVRLCESYCGV